MVSRSPPTPSNRNELPNLSLPLFWARLKAEINTQPKARIENIIEAILKVGLPTEAEPNAIMTIEARKINPRATQYFLIIERGFPVFEDVVMVAILVDGMMGFQI